MRIAIVTDEFPPDSRGGSGVVAWREAVALSKEGHQVAVFAPRSSDKIVTENFEVNLIGPDKPIKRNAWQAVFDTQFLESLKQPLVDFRPDVVHGHHVTSFFGLKSMDWCSRNFKTVLTVHDANWILPDKAWVNEKGGYEPGFLKAFWVHHLQFNPFLMGSSARLFEKVKAVIFVSDAIRNYYEKVLDRGSNFVTLHNALDLDEWPHTLLENKDIVRLGFASRLTGAKGSRIFIALIDKMNSYGQKTIGQIVGQKDRYQQFISKLDDRIKPMFEYGGFLKNDEDLRRWYKSLSASFVGSLYLDPFPNVTMESLAVGRGVIVGPYTGSREIVDESVGCRLTPKDIEDVTEVARKLVETKPFERWSRRCLELRDRLGMEEHVKRLMDIYCG